MAVFGFAFSEKIERMNYEQKRNLHFLQIIRNYYCILHKNTLSFKALPHIFMQKENTSNQQKFIDRIKTALPKNYSLVNELADLLGVSNDSAYRRIRGETSFTIDEIIKICERYKISFDSFCTSETGVVNFSYNRFLSNTESFNDYITDLLNALKRILSAKEKEIIYAAADIPIFHQFKFQELGIFKMFYWMKSTLNVPELEDKKYTPSLVDKDLIEKGKQIFEVYSKIPSIEIWSDLTIISTLKQIDYYYESGLFTTKDDAVNLCDALIILLENIQQETEHSTKASVAGYENNYYVYNSDVDIGNNCILVKTDGIKTVFLRNYTFNSMFTTNAAFCDETELWLKGFIKKSTLISGVSEKHRFRFFNNAREKVIALKEKIKGQ